MVPRFRRYYGRPFQTGQGVTQGKPVSPTILNIVVDVVVQAMLWEFCGPQEDLHGLGWADWEQDGMFYSENGSIVGIKSI